MVGSDGFSLVGCHCLIEGKGSFVVVLVCAMVVVHVRPCSRSLSSWKTESLDPFGEVCDHVSQGKKHLVTPFWLDNYALMEKDLESRVVGVSEEDT